MRPSGSGRGPTARATRTLTGSSRACAVSACALEHSFLGALAEERWAADKQANAATCSRAASLYHRGQGGSRELDVAGSGPFAGESLG